VRGYALPACVGHNIQVMEQSGVMDDDAEDTVALPRPTANDKTLLVIVVGDRCPEWEKL
jgi:hypothetical protein